MGSEKTYSFPITDRRKGCRKQIKNLPTVHIARGYETCLPFLQGHGRRALICIRDWQYETATQEHFWQQARRILEAELGKDIFESALVLVAGDMASCDDALMGSKSDDVPRLAWLINSFPQGNVFMIYGNHDFIDPHHLALFNEESGRPCLLPHGSSLAVSMRSQDATFVQESKNAWNAALKEAAASSSANNSTNRSQSTATNQHHNYNAGNRQSKRTPKTCKQACQKQWKHLHPERHGLVEQLKLAHEKYQTSGPSLVDHCNLPSTDSVLRIGAVHGIPSVFTEGFQKVEREEYFAAVKTVCLEPIDILVTHANTSIPRLHENNNKNNHNHTALQETDAQRLFQYFDKSSTTAKLHVHGHMHTEPAVAVLECGQVVVNSDCRVIAFAPSSCC